MRQPAPNDPFWKTLGGRIRKCREDRDMTQRQLAKQIGRSHGAIHQWENNMTSPTGKTLTKLLQVFPDLQLRDGIAPLSDGPINPSAEGLGGLERLGSKRLRLLADILEQRETLDKKMRELSEEQTPERPAKR